MLPVEVRDGAPACPKPASTRDGRVPQAVSACGALPRLRGGANVLLSVRGGRSRRASARGSHGRGVQGTRGGVDVRVDRGGGRPGSGSPLVGRLTDAARSAPACRRVSCLFAPRGAWHTAARASARRGVRPVEGAAGTHSVALRPRRVVHVHVSVRPSPHVVDRSREGNHHLRTSAIQGQRERSSLRLWELG